MNTLRWKRHANGFYIARVSQHALDRFIAENVLGWSGYSGRIRSWWALTYPEDSVASLLTGSFSDCKDLAVEFLERQP